MKPFNLAAALAGAPVVTRDGTQFIDIRHFPSISNPYKLAGVNKGSVRLIMEDGTNSDGSYLFMAPVKRTVWVNMYRNEDGVFYSGAVKDSKQSAAAQFDLDDYIGTYPLEIEE